MDIQQALCDLGATPDRITQQQRDQLDEQGFLILPEVIHPHWLEQLRERFEALCEAEGRQAGREVHREEGARRLSDLPNKGEAFDAVYTHPVVLACIAHVLQGEFKLSSLNARDALPGQGLQALHADWGANTESQYQVCNSIWLLDDFTMENGCTRVVPGTHKDGKSPTTELEDAYAKHPDEVYITAPAGSVGIFNSHLWHGGTKNITQDTTRRAMHCYFTARRHNQQLDQSEHIRLKTWKRLSPAARYILDVDIA